MGNKAFLRKETKIVWRKITVYYEAGLKQCNKMPCFEKNVLELLHISMWQGLR